jgi:hypothetical protein
MELSLHMKKTLVLILVLLIVILLLLYLAKVWSSSSPSEVDIPVSGQQETQAEGTFPAREETAGDEQKGSGEASVRTLAKTFAERFGSYSNEAAFANLEDVFPLMTEAYAARMQEAMESWSASQEYYAVTTHVLSVEMETDEETGTAQVILKTQREEARGEVQNVSILYQDLALDLVYTGGTWLVDRATWQ